MRKIQFIIAIALIGIAVFASCSRSSSSASPTYFMKATTGSTTMNATVCVAGSVAGTLAISGSTVSGGVGGPPQINISITSWSGTTGSVSLGTASTTSSFAEYTSSTGGTTLLSQSGTVNITSVSSTTITGTFNFTCTDGTVISAGTFSAKRS